MAVSEFTFKLLLLFFPGLVCTFLIDQLTVHRQRTSFFFVMQAFVLGLISYLSFWALKCVSSWFCSGIDTSLTFLRALSDSSVTYSFAEIALVALCAVAIGIAVSAASEHNWLHRTARRLRVTQKFGHLDVWGVFMNEKEIVWVTVRDHANDLVFDGWVRAFSDDSENAQLFLRDVSVYRNSSEECLYQVGALYLARNLHDISVECRTIAISDELKWKEKVNEQPETNADGTPEQAE
jgi:Family of unknown function (DUF6338)